MKYNLLGEGLLLLCEVDIISEAFFNGELEAFPHALDDVFAVLGSVDNPADGLLEAVALGSFNLIETSIGVITKDFSYDSQNIQQQVPSGIVACTTNTILYSMKQYDRRVEYFYFCQLVLLQTFCDALNQ